MPTLSYENEFCMQFHFHANQGHFHKNGFALRLALKPRLKGTRKWPIRFSDGKSINLVLKMNVIKSKMITLMKRTRLLNLKDMFRKLLCHCQFTSIRKLTMAQELPKHVFQI